MIENRFRGPSSKSNPWKDRVRDIYSSIEELRAYDRTYGIAGRLGYKSATELWNDNPMISGSVHPKDPRVIRRGERLSRKGGIMSNPLRRRGGLPHPRDTKRFPGRMFGSQYRETLAQAGYRLRERLPHGEVVLEDLETGKLELYALNDRASGHVIEVGGKGYEFVRDYHPQAGRNPGSARVRGGLIAYYNELEYRIHNSRTGEDVYTAGNSPHDSQVFTSAEDGVGLRTMKEYAEHTGKEIAEETGVPFLGAEHEDPET